ncbi:coenzyme A disulfide reductase [Candidatus Methanoplasma termitum]|uniref:Coenzyme A disulfide reductase n=1 Tax=Candidatus Methanoplasma termitum TaxID=1577791 RepID=A0A0A7LCV7_9ARCH|nr:FAD-dependent oxidoreductase [Candidatus Methanoplasma termitum]AIZ56848.1 coenzyme A disulfide reductase [Candidatus Methanoplasma termitum]MCL2333212.1 FAD-dependent oxidoreductase [Candidatus Methanoplasma sp.]
MGREIIVIGSGGAGMTAASTARRTDPNSKITVITEDTDIAYSSCVIPWAIEGKVSWDSAVMHTPDHYSAKKKIDVLTQTKVESVDDSARTVTAGGRTYRYDSLVIATGGKVFIPPIKGTDLKGVFIVRTIRDGKDIQSYTKKIKKAVVCGAGVIGLETALALSHLGKDVTVIEMFDQIMPRMADKDMADVMREYLEGKGIKFVLSTPVQSVNGSEKVSGVTAGNTVYPCELVIFATGIRSNVDIPKQLGFDIGQLGGVVVSPSLNPYRKGELIEDIYLAGDVIQCESAVVPGPAMSQLGSSAVRQGRVAGINAAGGKALYGPVASPWVSVMGDVEIAGTGLSTGLAAWYKVPTVYGKAEGLTRARYYPGAKKMKVKIIADAATHRLIGAQIIAGEGTTGRINWLTSAIISKMTAEDFLIRSENAYCPPTSMVKDVIVSAVEDLCKNFEAQ